MSVPANKRVNDLIRKKLFKTFKNLCFRIHFEANMKIDQFLDVGFHLSAGSVSPYVKPNTTFKYVNTRSNQQAIVIKHILKGVECRNSRNFSTKEIFQCNKWCMKRH